MTPPRTHSSSCTSHPHPYARERSSQETCSREYGLCQKRGRARAARAPAVLANSTQRATRKNFSVCAGVAGGSGENRDADLLSHASLRGDAGFAGLRKADRLWLGGLGSEVEALGGPRYGMGGLVLAEKIALRPWYIRLFCADMQRVRLRYAASDCVIFFLTPEALQE
jgi:hypothetical protein